jgi:hypothetical protein
MGKVNIWEILIIAVAIMWLLGVFRRSAKPAGPAKKTESSKAQELHGQTKPTKEKRYGDNDSEYVDYEEVK